MGITSLQVCMDDDYSSDCWLHQVQVHDDDDDEQQGSENIAAGLILEHCSNYSSPPLITISTHDACADDLHEDDMHMLTATTCSTLRVPPAALMERRLRPPPHEQSLKCPRCESTHTKFCYYNNYSLSQPRYFCKTCRRYWTKGGTLRNIPVGGGCRKNNKKQHLSAKSNSINKKQSSNHHESSSTSTSSPSPAPLPQNNTCSTTAILFSSPIPPNYHNYYYNNFHTPIDHHHHQNNNNNNYNGEEINFGGLMQQGEHDYDYNYNYNNHGAGGTGICSHDHQFGIMNMNMSTSSFEHGTCNNISANSNNILESCQRMMMVPYENNHTHLDVKPNSGVNLSIEWHQQQQQQEASNSNAGKDSFGFNFGGLGSWTGLMNGYGSSATNPLV
ncbi:hypothetical protein ACJIZ3_009937 [Penstemon smallii]|uniref:Dof zinc finger protein n=1 Tax=Penstemon smallii TaxID=265156 RepID=A0ABD3TF02_9LAMI